MSYFIVRNSEDGIQVYGPLDKASLLDSLEAESGEEVVPEYRAECTTTMPTEYTDSKFWYIIKGEPVLASPKRVVAEWDVA